MPVRLVFRVAALGVGVVLIITGIGLAVLGGKPTVPIVFYEFMLLSKGVIS